MIKIKINKIITDNDNPDLAAMEEDVELSPEKRDQLVQQITSRVDQGSDDEKDAFLAKNLEENIKKYIIHLLSR